MYVKRLDFEKSVSVTKFISKKSFDFGRGNINNINKMKFIGILLLAAGIYLIFFLKKFS